jgi:hypothetical protein
MRRERSMTRAPRRCCRAATIASLVLLAACGANTGPSETKIGPSENPGTSLTLPSVSLRPATLTELVAYLAKAGLAVPNPRDVTQRDCPAIGCTKKVETDTVAIMAFSTTGRAQLYAGSTSHVFQVTNLVVSFSASVPTAAQGVYEAAIQRAVE